MTKSVIPCRFRATPAAIPLKPAPITATRAGPGPDRRDDHLIGPIASGPSHRAQSSGRPVRSLGPQDRPKDRRPSKTLGSPAAARRAGVLAHSLSDGPMIHGSQPARKVTTDG